MALTTKFIKTTVTDSFSISRVYSFNRGYGSSSGGAYFYSSESFIYSNISSAISSIYTVPAGRTAKVYFNPKTILSMSYLISDSYSFSMSNPVNHISITYYLTPYMDNSAFYDSYYSLTAVTQSISTGEMFPVGTLFNSSRTSSFVFSSNYQVYVNTASDSFENGLPYVLMAPGQPLAIQIAPSFVMSKIYRAYTLSGLSSALILNSFSMTGVFTYTVECMVIEESGS